MTKVKICGITRLEDAELAIELGAWALGFILWPQSKRYVDPGVAAGIARAGAAQGRDRRRVRQPAAGRDRRTLVDVLGLTHVQLHGDEGPSFCQAVAQRTGAKVIKAVRIGARLRPARPRALPHRLPPARHRRQPAQYGGTGRTWDWSLLAQRRAKIAVPARRRADRRRTSPTAIAAARPWGVDVASGVEAAPGHQGPGQARGVLRRGRSRARRDDRRSSTASAPTAASTSRRRSCPRWSSSRRRGSPPATTRATSAELDALLNDYVGRPSPLYLAQRLSDEAGHAVYLKREDLNHTGAHKINNALGQALLAKRMGKTRIIAETGAGSHGVATATACALLGLECIVYMGTEDMRRQAPNVQRMGLLGATRGARRRRRARRSRRPSARDPRLGRERRRHALRDRLVRRPGAVPGARARPAADHRRRGARADPREDRPAAGPRDRLRRRRLERDRHLHRRSSATPTSQLVGVEAAGEGIETGRHGAPLTVGGRGGVLHGAYQRDHAGRGRPDPRGALDLAPASTIPAPAPSTRGCATPAARRYVGGDRRRGARRVPAARRARGDHPGARVRARGRLGARRGPRDATDDTIDLVCLSGRGDKDLAEALDKLGLGVSAETGADRIAAAFKAARGRAALMPYLMGGFPDVETSVAVGDRLRRRRRRPRSSSACRSATRSPTAP